VLIIVSHPSRLYLIAIAGYLADNAPPWQVRQEASYSTSIAQDPDAQITQFAKDFSDRGQRVIDGPQFPRDHRQYGLARDDNDIDDGR
jgi:hypothetical protein